TVRSAAGPIGERTNPGSIRSARKPSTSSAVPASSRVRAISGLVSRKSRITRGTRGWNEAELVKPRPSRPVSPRAARRAASTAVFGAVEHDPRLREKGFARRGQLDTARLAPEQLDFE